MKKLMAMAMAVVCVTCMSASAAFVAPTEAQIAAAAANPTALAALLQGASAQQAAEVLRVVITASMGLGLTPEAQSARVTAIVSAGFTAVATPATPGAAPAATPTAFAAALGTALGTSPTISQNGAVVATVQSAVTTAGGGGTAGQALAVSFTQALQASVAANMPAKGYEIQQ